MYFWNYLSDHGEAHALITEDQIISYTQLALRADDFVHSIRARLPASITRPLVLLEAVNELASIIAYLGLLRAGWPVILVAEGAGADHSGIVQTYAPNVLVQRRSHGWQVDLAAHDAVEMHPDLAVLLSTSGTTGAAKLVRLSAQNLQANATAITSYLDVRADDRTITTLPFHYSYGMSVLHIHLLRGAGLVLSEGSLVDPDFRALAQRTGVTSLALVPTQFELFETTTWLPQLRYITQAGGRMDPVLARRFAEMATAEGWRLFIMYGQTEAGPRMSYLPPRDAADWFHTIGRPIPGGSFRLIDAAGAEIAQPGVPGELIYEGPSVMLGYALARIDLAASAGPQILHTGDIAERLDNGYYRIVGRASRFIKLFGLRIALDEVETHLRNEGHRVYASGTDARLVLFAQDKPGCEALRTSIAKKLKLPVSAVLVELLQEVPLLPSGKVDYRALARRAEALAVSQEQVVRNEESLEGLLKAALSTPILDMDRNFLDAGGDSLSYLEVQLYLSSRLGHAPAGWERLPLRDLLAFDVPTSLEIKVPIGTLQEVSADLLARVAAIFAVITLHATTWPTGGGAYLLLILVGYSLARFQSGVLFEGRVLHTYRSMLLPLVVCYYILISAAALFWPPIDLEFFLLVENFVPKIEPHGMTPYWYVSTYVQVILIATLPFVLSGLRRTIAAHPLAAGCSALIGSVVVMRLAGLEEIVVSLRHHHPIPALQLLLMGWCAFFAVSSVQRGLVSLLILGLWWVCWGDAPIGITLWALIGAVAVVWGLRVRLPRGVARGLMRIGGLTLYLYLLHVPIMVLVLPRMPDSPEALQLAAVIALTLIASVVSKAVYDRTAAWLQGLRVLCRFMVLKLKRTI